MEVYILVGFLSLVSGFLSGLLGIGGGIVMAPLLLFIPQLFGFEVLSMQTVAGLTIIQGLLASITGTLSHYHFRMVSVKLSIYMGLSIFITAMIGGIGSRYVSNEVLLFLFACMAMCSALFILLPVRDDTEFPNIDELVFSRWRAVAAAAVVGLLGGMVGQGGSFILIPMMIYFIRIPTRISIGSNLAIVLLSTAAASIGKALTGQIAWLLCVPVAVSVIPAAYTGSMLSKKVPVKRIRILLAFVIAAAAGRIWYSLLII